MGSLSFSLEEYDYTGWSFRFVFFRRVYHDLSDDYCCYCGGHYFHRTNNCFRSIVVARLFLKRFFLPLFVSVFCGQLCFCLRSDDCYCFSISLMTVLISLPPLSDCFCHSAVCCCYSPPGINYLPRCHCRYCILSVYCLPGLLT